MSKSSDSVDDLESLREKLIGLGERSLRKTYYPELQEKLAELERFRALLDQSNDCIFLLSIPSLGLVDVNESAYRQLNYSRHELLSLSFADLVPAETVAAINLLIAAKGGENGNREILTTTLSKSGGGDLPVEVTIRLVTFDTECYGVAVARDITERRRAEEALRQQFSQLADIIDFLPDATFVIDAEGKIIIWNRAAEEFTGVKAEEMLGKGNREYSIPFYGERRPVLIDLVFAPSPETEKLYPQVKRDGVMVIGESLTRSIKRGEAYMLGIAAPLTIPMATSSEQSNRFAT